MRKLAASFLVLCLPVLLVACGEMPKQNSPADSAPALTSQTLANSTQPPAEGAGPVGDNALFSAGTYHSCAIKEDNSLTCWGLNDKGQATAPAGTFRAVSAGDKHTCALKTDGTLACWGDNTSGQATPPAGTFLAVSSGANHSCALKADASAACWGDNTSGQAPSHVSDMFVAIDAGGNTTCGIKIDNSARCWGAISASPASGKSFYSLSVGGNLVCGVQANSRAVFCWNNTISDLSVSAFHSVATAGDDFYCGVVADNTGAILCKGFNGATVPTPPSGVPYSALSAGGKHVCALNAANTLVCSGDNSKGQSSVPLQPQRFAAVDVGSLHICGIRQDQTLACWGAGTTNTGKAPRVWTIHASKWQLPFRKRGHQRHLRRENGRYGSLLGAYFRQPSCRQLPFRSHGLCVRLRPQDGRHSGLLGE